jgi:anti-anti-sigma factor
MAKHKEPRHIHAVDGNKLAVTGDLTLKTARKVYEESLKFAGQESLPVEFDLEGVGHVDSAGMALLLEWQSWAHRHNHHFRFSNAPQHLMKLATLSDAEHMLDLHPKAVSS